ncbi:hypothetical protein ABDJ41_19805 [Pedobacter sp. ASV1-7]|uniref:hypothetical protein n=1 Tax=Pedobacter sp. ASV1-7 TaxID=3145237 RepID=UPI0032E924EA
MNEEMDQWRRTQEDIDRARNAARSGYFYDPSTPEGRIAKGIAEREKAQYDEMMGKTDGVTGNAGGGIFFIMAATVIIATPFVLYKMWIDYFRSLPGELRVLIEMSFRIVAGLLTGFIASWIMIRFFKLNPHLKWMMTFAIGIIASIFYLSKINDLMYLYYDYYFNPTMKFAFIICMATLTGALVTLYQYLLTDRKLNKSKWYVFSIISISAFITYFYLIQPPIEKL